MSEKKKKANGKESSIHDWTSLMGNDKKILLCHCPEKINDFLRPETADKIKNMAGLCNTVQKSQ